MADEPSTPGQEKHFSHNLRVLAIDDNIVCLKVLAFKLQKCGYQVTDVIRSDIDGFELLEIIDLRMDIPVIMTSANNDLKNIEKGIKHGARDYLEKPVRKEILRNIWQHVMRKISYNPRVNKQIEADKSFTRNLEPYKRNYSGEDCEITKSPDEKPPVCKKARVTWTPDLHAKFVTAIQHLGEKAVRKNILRIMNEPQLTRQNVASHLQKYRSAKQKETMRQEMKNRSDANRTRILCDTNVHASPSKNHGFHARNDQSAEYEIKSFRAIIQPDFNTPEYQPIQYRRNMVNGYEQHPHQIPLSSAAISHHLGYLTRRNVNISSQTNRLINRVVPYSSCALDALTNHVGTSNQISGNDAGQTTLFSQPDSAVGLPFPTSLAGHTEARNLATFDGKGGLDFREEARANGPQFDMRGQVDGSTDNEHRTNNYTQFLLNDSDSQDDDLSAIVYQFSEDDAPNI
ncbi:hypothetical protein ACH5RR_004395 [Cinchona calisaya]|uniref:Response regulatory domain-containing protein n=1 Tax=Cinchona calisaya TaxID=153742 RepID=A0ABD3AXH1_9GENT